MYKSVQAHNVVMDAHISNVLTHCANRAVVFPHADLHDLQCLVVFRCCIRRSNWLFPVRLEKICYRRRHGTLSLVVYVFIIHLSSL